MHIDVWILKFYNVKSIYEITKQLINNKIKAKDIEKQKIKLCPKSTQNKNKLSKPTINSKKIK
jgi:hypothetical protein